MPEAAYADPLGRGTICRAGTDATVVTVAPLLAEALKVAGQLAPEGISIEVLDPRSLLPFDHALLRQSVVKTGRLILFDDANRTCGFAADVAAWAAEEVFANLRGPTRPFHIGMDANSHRLDRSRVYRDARATIFDEA